MQNMVVKLTVNGSYCRLELSVCDERRAQVSTCDRVSVGRQSLERMLLAVLQQSNDGWLRKPFRRGPFV